MLCASSVLDGETGPQQVEVLSRNSINFYSSVLAPERMVPELDRDASGTSYPSYRKDLLCQLHVHRFHQNLSMLQLPVWRVLSALPETRILSE